MSILNKIQFSSSYKLPMVLQSEVAECGLACLAMVLGFHGHKTDLITLRQNYNIGSQGMDLESLINLAELNNLSCRPLRLDLHEVSKLETPAVLHWDLDHFVVLKRATGKFVWIHDPAKGALKLTYEQVSKHFTGIGVEFIPNTEFEAKTEEAKVPLSVFWKSYSGVKRVLLQVFILSFLLQAFALISPFFTQIVLDDIILSEDTELLLIVSLGFLLLGIISQATSALRSLVLLYVGNKISALMTTSLFKHLLKLPLSYFEKRHLGDVVSRFGSLGSIQSLLTTGVISVILDGLMAITTLIMMFIYLPKLAWVVILATTLYALLRLISYSPFKRLNEEQIHVSAKEDSHFMESIRAIQSLKVFGKENHRQQVWQNHFAETINVGIKTSKLSLVFEIVNGLLFAIENIVVIYLGASSVIHGQISIGMLMAFISYKSQFSGKSSALIDQFIEFKMLSLHLTRVADIALSETEKGLNEKSSQVEIIGSLELKDISFQYDMTQPLIFENINLKVQAGESLAIIGPSGQGKTTLLKIMMGLFETTSGKVEIDGKKVTDIGLVNIRKNTAAVMQDDQLFAGTISSNISFYDPQPCKKKIEQCAFIAGICDDINQMPMGFDTLIGDMGSSLSGGQKQRVLLARALYHEPKILFLDEATSHLDIQLESFVNESIRQLNITRIIIAHRPETIKSADRVVVLRNGELRELDISERVA